MAMPHHPQYPPYPQPSFPPRVDGKELRPGRVWFFVGALVLVLGIIGGILGFVISLASSVGLPELEHRVRAGESITFEVTGTETVNLGLYANGNAIVGDCTLSTPDGRTEGFDYPGYSHTGALNGESWRLVGVHDAAQPGEHTMDCQYTGMDTTYALGDVGNGEEDFVRGALTGVAFMVGLPLIGAIVGITVMVVTGVRRGRHRRQLIAERSQGRGGRPDGWPGHPGHPGGHPGGLGHHHP
ncbi:hypothetical protein [Nocardiopsis alkaliphila]|uniref:hypothetical protein n=1 Tax=Nocardiopsis alkaliphila TaxID=225762 RepID=UPI00034DEE81|nr:hypothetical protein [Nocardiopsis alkaliphila]